MYGKKLLALLLTVLTAWSCLAVPGFADDGTGEELKTILLSVKSKADIPDTCTEFSYSVSSDEWEGRIWHLRWNTKDRSELSISVTADQVGEIISYRKNTPDSLKLLPATFTQQEAETLAAEFLCRANTTTKDRFFPVAVLSQMDAFLVTFQEKVNGIPVKGSQATVAVNKADRRISRMDVDRNYKEASFPAIENILSTESAQAAYLKEIGFRCSYRTYVDYETKTVKGYPVYTSPKQRSYAVDAVTGKAVDITSTGSRYPLNDATKGSNSARDEATSLSEAELAEIAKTQALMTQQQALATVQQLFGKSFTLESAYLSRSHLSEADYVWSLNLKDSEKLYAYASVDANTGLVTSFFRSDSDKEKKGSLSAGQAEQKAAAIFQSNAGEIIAEYARSAEITEAEHSYTLLFHRTHDNLPVEDQTLRVTIDKNGIISAYDLTYYKNTNFAEAPQSTDANTSDIFDAFAKNVSFELCYIPVTKEKQSTVVLAYDFMTSSMPALDGKTLVPVDYRGEPIQKDTPPVYTDLDGHWVKDLIDTLAYNAIYMVKENQFRPDEKVTESEFIDFLDGGAFGLPYPIHNLLRSGKKEEILTDGNRDKPIDRQTAAKYLVKLLGYDELTAKPEAFQYLFQDQADEANKPYIMICYILDIMKGDSSGCFHAEEPLTRAETAVILYNTLKNNKFRF